MEGVLAGDDPRPAGRRAAELQRRFDRLGAGAREEHAPERRGRALEQCAREQTRERRDTELHFARRLQLESLNERRPDARVVAADVVHPEAAEQVEKPRAVRVVEIRTLRPLPASVEADRPEQTHELRVDRPRVEVELLAPVLVEQLAQGHTMRESVRSKRAGARPRGRRARRESRRGSKPRSRPASRLPGRAPPARRAARAGPPRRPSPAAALAVAPGYGAIQAPRCRRRRSRARPPVPARPTGPRASARSRRGGRPAPTSAGPP